MYKQILGEKTEHVLNKIAGSGISDDFYLAGGTALAIQFGHRKSDDLDWFSNRDFSNSRMKEKLSGLGTFELITEEEGTIHGALDGVRVSFLQYGYPMLFPFIHFEKVHLADERDIAAMKIDAVSSRGSRKDFVDIYFLLKKYPLSDLIDFFEKKYENIQFNKLHILKSLAFFDDAEMEPMPVMIKPADWADVKERIREETNKILKL